MSTNVDYELLMGRIHSILEFGIADTTTDAAEFIVENPDIYSDRLVRGAIKFLNGET